MTGHIHWNLMQAYAAEAEFDPEPWRNWEVRNGSAGKWEPLTSGPSWYSDNKYRRRPPFININGFEVPEPMRVAPERGTQYYLVSLHLGSSAVKAWKNLDYEKERLALGLCHLTPEAADAHSEALLSFTRRDIP